jgi:hypothetical protein
MSTDDVTVAWDAFRAAYFDAIVARRRQFALGDELLAHPSVLDVLQGKLRSKDWLLVVELLRRLPGERLIPFLPRLFELASVGHGSITAVREAISAAPREYVERHLRELVEPLLQPGEEEEFRRMYELFRHMRMPAPAWFVDRVHADQCRDVRELEAEFSA